MNKRFLSIALALILCGNTVLLSSGPAAVEAAALVEAPIDIKSAAVGSFFPNGDHFKADRLIDMSEVTLSPDNNIANATYKINGFAQWLTADNPAPQDVWALFELDGTQDIHRIAIWNSNFLFGDENPGIGRGLKDITVSWSANSTNGTNGTWQTLGSYVLPAAPGNGSAITPQLVLTFDKPARYVKITGSSNYGHSTWGLGKVVLTGLFEAGDPGLDPEPSPGDEPIRQPQPPRNPEDPYDIAVPIKKVTAGDTLPHGSVRVDYLITTDEFDVWPTKDIMNTRFVGINTKCWVTNNNPGLRKTWVMLELAQPEDIERIIIWNNNHYYGENGGRGFKDVMITYSADSSDGTNGTWKTLGRYILPEAPGDMSPIKPQFAEYVDDTVRFIKIQAFSNYGHPGWGLGKIVLTKNTSRIPLESVALNKDSLNLDKGQSERLSFSYNPANTTDDDPAIWFSSDRAVATVAQDGTVTAAGGGQAVITVNVNGRTAQSTVTVSGTPVTPPEPEKPFLAGDVNNSGEVDIGDARLVLQHLVNKITLTGRALLAADVDGKGVSISSARLILQFLVDKVKDFPEASWPEPEGPDVPSSNPLMTAVEAVDYDQAVLTGGAEPNQLAADFTSIGGSFKAGDSLTFNAFDFGDGEYNTMMTLISSKTNQTDRNIDVYIDSMAPANLIATVKPPAARGENAFSEAYTAVKAVTGSHDVILCFREDMELNLDWFTFSTFNGSETKEHKDARMKWWRDAHFGQFIHFGPYSMLGGEYNGRKVGLGSGTEWVMLLLGIGKQEYAQNVSKKFNPTSFYEGETGAYDMIALAKKTGQKYITVTTKHHDGFSMYDTNVRTFKDYKITGFGDYKGPDPMAELKRECAEQGVRFGIYYSIPDWYDYTQSDWGGRIDPAMKDEYKTRVKAQLRELVLNYDPGVIWFDQGGDRQWWNDNDGIELYRFVRTLSPEIILDNRVFSEGNLAMGDYGTPENHPPSGPQNYDWECCQTVNIHTSWGYRKNSEDWRSPEDILSSLIDIVSKGGSLLLNVGPDGEGRVPAGCAAVMEQVGAWLRQYGGSIYGTRRSYAGVTKGGFKLATKDDKIYVFIEEAPRMKYIVIPTPVNNIISARDIGSSKQLGYAETAQGIALDLSGLDASGFCTVIEIN
ncbi:MAG: alpha-L-fucosidase [Oscillospiraceae bacterium]|nr:alpha-L-fucosidase [Oscillospiraceae bacterium]